MTINEENMAWAMKKLLSFANWKNFPAGDDDLESRCKSFLKLVHNKPVREIVVRNKDWEEAMLRNGAELPPVRYPIDPDTNDADWILEVVRETMDTFPLPIEMRDIYEKKLPPAVDVYKQLRRAE